MDSTEKLKSSLKESLINKGILNKIKAHMRQEIYNILDNDNDKDNANYFNQKPKLTKENIIINELIKEYFIFNGYTFSSNVLQSEVGQTNNNLNRDNIIKELNIIENGNNKNRPLLYTILSGLQNKNDILIPLKIENNI